MCNLKKALFGAVSVIFVSATSYAGAIEHVPISSHILSHTLELKPISPSEYLLAKATFLPETYDDLGLSGHENTRYNHNQGNNCTGYELTTCPANGNCSSCPFDRRYKRLISCATGYNKSGNLCSPGSCSVLGYESTIPTNKICTQHTEGRLTCYKGCRTISCSEYPLNCDTFNVANSSGKTTCPDCENATANCSPKLCKINKCLDGYKVSENGRECILLDDTCPNGYYKDCQTGTTGEPQFTEKGTVCYKCQARTCANGSYNLNVYWCNGALKCLLPAN